MCVCSSTKEESRLLQSGINYLFNRRRKKLSGWRTCLVVSWWERFRFSLRVTAVTSRDVFSLRTNPESFVSFRRVSKSDELSGESFFFSPLQFKWDLTSLGRRESWRCIFLSHFTQIIVFIFCLCYAKCINDCHVSFKKLLWSIKSRIMYVT